LIGLQPSEPGCRELEGFGGEIKVMDLKRILLVHLGGGVGDLLLSTALLGELKRNFDNPSVAMMIRQGYEDVLLGHPHLDEVISVEEGSLEGLAGINRWKSVLVAGKFDAAITLWSTSTVAWLLYLSAIPVRVGQDSRLLYSFLYTHKVSVRSEKGDITSHWVECLLDYIRAIGCSVESPEILLTVTDEARERVRRMLGDAGAWEHDLLYGFHVGKGLPLDERRWPVRHFAEIADAIAEYSGAKMVLTGDRREVELVSKVESLMKSRAINMAGKTNLKELAALIGCCSAFICPDSAPMHIAAAMRVPTVGIFALKSDFPYRWRPFGTTYEIVTPEVIDCPERCIKENCGRFSCYERISPDSVVAALERLKVKKGAISE
jgi:lipopolysaccharide heptosyltransferase II